MDYLALTLPDLDDNLALDEALLLDAEERGARALLRLWEWPRPAVVLGAGGQVALDVDEAACRAAGVPLARRASGGGTVLLGPGCLCYSLVLPYALAPPLGDVTASYGYILDRVRTALDDVAPGCERAGISDLALAGRKFSGNAQQRKSAHVLHHGTLLYDFPLDMIGRYLRQPPRQPEYRQQRDHGAFVMNLPAPRADLETRLRSAWGAATTVTDWPAERVQALTAAKYGRAEWVRRR